MFDVFFVEKEKVVKWFYVLCDEIVIVFEGLE